MTPELEYRDDVLHLEDVSLEAVAARCGTPAYVYSHAHFTAQYQRLDHALGGIPHRICFAVKANSNLAVLRLFGALGAGFDIVSGGELERVLHAGGDPSRIVFSGVGKSAAEIGFALRVGIGCFNVEGEAELARIEEQAARAGVRAPVALRVNPDIDAGTHPYISTGLKRNKFGVPAADAPRLFARARSSAHVEIVGIGCHIGSQIATPAPLIEALERLLELVDELAADGIRLHHLDLGGGLGVAYRDEAEFDLDTYQSALRQRLSGRGLELVLEPGRFLVANGGILLTRVEYLKPASDPGGRNFAIVDAAMNDFIRPTLYGAWHAVEPVRRGAHAQATWDVVGPVCESGDFLAHDRRLALADGDLLAILGAGAYGFVQSSNYNSRDRAPEVLVDGARFTLVRRRETARDQLALEEFDGATPNR
jgi:diaminopimelate decarboxylase